MTFGEWLDRYIQVMKKVRGGKKMTKADWEPPNPHQIDR